MAEALTEIHLVRDLEQAYRLANDLGALGIGLDVEGVLIPYVGNDPFEDDLPRDDHPNEILTQDFQEQRHCRIRLGLMTNNTNSTINLQYTKKGLVADVAYSAAGFIDDLPFKELPFVHKDMVMPDGTVVLAKPSGQQGTLLAAMLGIDPRDMVLIDDQGVKNAGEAVKAGFKAIIVPNPIGNTDSKGRVIEHKGVMRFRKLEPLVYRSLQKRGNIAAKAYKYAAGINLDQIADFQDHRARH